MTAEANYQYRATPVVGTGDPVSVGDVLTMARNINNTKAFGAVQKIRGQAFYPWCYSTDTKTTEIVTLVMCPVFIPEGCTSLTWTLTHKRTAGGDTIDWTLYCLDQLYIGPQDPIDTDRAGVNRTSDRIQCDQGTWYPQTSTLNIVRAEDSGMSWFILTSKNGDGSTRGAICSLDITPRIA